MFLCAIKSCNCQPITQTYFLGNQFNLCNDLRYTKIVRGIHFVIILASTVHAPLILELMSSSYTHTLTPRNCFGIHLFKFRVRCNGTPGPSCAFLSLPLKTPWATGPEIHSYTLELFSIKVVGRTRRGRTLEKECFYLLRLKRLLEIPFLDPTPLLTKPFSESLLPLYQRAANGGSDPSW